MLRDNHNEMDALFREGAERHDFPYNEDAWAMMDAQLDAADRKRRFFWWMMSGLVLMLLSAITYYTISKNNTLADNVVEVNNTPTQSTITTTTQNDTKSIMEADVKTAETKNVAELKSNSTPANKNVTEEKPNTKNSSLASTINIESIEKQEESSNTYFSEANSKEGNSNSVVVNTSSAVAKEDVQAKSSTTLIKDIMTVEPSTIAESGERAIMDKPVSLGILSPSVLSFDADEIDTKVIVPATSSSSRWAFGIYAAPEWSSVGFLGKQKMGFALGTKLGYQFADKFELSLGVGYSKKIYSGSGKEYTMTEGWYGDIEPMVMDAKCHIIEFPLALNYYANGYKNNGFFAEAGISSYMLHTEWYGFEYDAALVRPESIVEVTENNENKHLVGVGRLAIGYQKNLSNNNTFQVAPYVQFPMTGIGAGQVDLYNMGVQFSLKFNTK